MNKHNKHETNRIKIEQINLILKPKLGLKRCLGNQTNVEQFLEVADQRNLVA
jgi:hypothetical protein